MTLPPSDPIEPARHRGRWVALALGAGALVLVGGYAATVVAVSGDVPIGTSVRGVDIGGMTTDEAAATLEEELGDEAGAPIPVSAGEATTDLEPEESGLSVDWAATASQASGLVLRPVDLVAHLRGEVELEPIRTTDSEALASSLGDLAQTADTEPVEPEIKYTKKAVATLTPGEPGIVMDVAGAADMVSAAYFQPGTGTATPLVLPVATIATQVPNDEAMKVFTELAEPAVALPVALAIGKAEATVQPADVARTLTFEPEGSTLAATLDGAELHKRLTDELAGIERPGRDASVRISNGRPVVVPSRTGRSVDSKELGTAVLAVLPGTTPDARRAVVALNVIDPDLTTAEAKALNITEKLSSFRQPFVPAEYRYINVGQAARRMNGTILEPGETFSMNDTIKERTVANGYTEGFIISRGRFREELGGGVSIITTATWTAGFFAGLERVEQHPHGLYISRYEAGLEATVAWGLLDLRMRNETGNGVLITATRYTDGVVIEMWGTKKWEDVTATFTQRRNYTDFETIYDDGEKCVPSQGVRGFSIAVTRRRINNGKSESTETWPTTYKPTPNVVCGP